MKLGILLLGLLLSGFSGWAQDRYRMEVEVEVKLDYQFFDSLDGFAVRYRIPLKGIADGNSTRIQESAPVQSTVTGYYSRWDSGACALQVHVENLDFEIDWERLGENFIRLRGSHSPIMEKWSSHCTFRDAPGERVVSQGSAEEWFARGLQPLFVRLRELDFPVDPEHRSETFFHSTMPPFSVDDEVGEGILEGSLHLKVIPLE